MEIKILYLHLRAVHNISMGVSSVGTCRCLEMPA